MFPVKATKKTITEIKSSLKKNTKKYDTSIHLFSLKYLFYFTVLFYDFEKTSIQKSFRMQIVPDDIPWMPAFAIFGVFFTALALENMCFNHHFNLLF